MASVRERAAFVALLRLGRRPWKCYAETVEREGGAEAVFNRDLAEFGRQGTLLPDDPEPLIAAATADLQRWEALGYRLTTVLDEDYPANLRGVHDRPPIVFIAGQLTSADMRSLAVIGSRRATDQGLLKAGEVAARLARSGFVIISGLAEGIDTAAHQAALGVSGRTVAVIGTGLGRSYPPGNEALQRAIATRGAVVSQFWPETPPSRGTFPQRNAVMSGLSLGTVVIEASVTSGARIQARLALAHGRPVFLACSVADQRWGRELTTHSGVRVFDDPDQITAEIVRRHDDGALVE